MPDINVMPASSIIVFRQTVDFKCTIQKQLRPIYIWHHEYLQRQKHECEQMYETDATQAK